MSIIGAVFVRDGSGVDRRRVATVRKALSIPGETATAQTVEDTVLTWCPSDAFTPEDAFDRQPVECRAGWILVFTGLLHHREDLAARLALNPSRTEKMADSALFAHAWNRWRENVGVLVEGRFAAVLWNAQRRVMLAVCSPWDAPPLCFSITRGRAIVATLPRGVFAWGDVPRRINDTYLASTLLYDHHPPSATFFEDVHWLCPGEMLEVTPETDRILRYYDPAEQVKPIRLPAESDYVEAAADLLRGAVKSTLRAPETPALMLSGGLDSSAVAVTAIEALAAPLVSFTACPEPGWDGRVVGNGNGDESPQVRALAARYPALDPRFVRCRGLGIDYLSSETMGGAEMPAWPSNLYWIHRCMQLTRAAGKRVILTAALGNATLSFIGHPRLAALLRQGRWPTLFREAAALSRGPRGMLHCLRLALTSSLSPRLYWSTLGRRRPGALSPAKWTEYSAIHPDFARDTHADQRLRGSPSRIASQGFKSCPEAQVGILSFPLLQGNDRALRHAMSLIHRVVDRDPYSDRRLIEWCLGIPDRLYLSHGRSRRLIRLLMRHQLPSEILYAKPGIQGADVHMRLGRMLPRIRETLMDWRDVPAIARRLDLDRLLRAADTWPAKLPLSRGEHPDFRIIQVGFDRALAAGQFIHWVESGCAWRI